MQTSGCGLDLIFSLRRAAKEPWQCVSSRDIPRPSNPQWMSWWLHFIALIILRFISISHPASTPPKTSETWNAPLTTTVRELRTCSHESSFFSYEKRWRMKRCTQYIPFDQIVIGTRHKDISEAVNQLHGLRSTQYRLQIGTMFGARCIANSHGKIIYVWYIPEGWIWLTTYEHPPAASENIVWRVKLLEFQLN